MNAASGKQKRVVVFVASLGSGGAERVAVRICGWLRDAGHEVCLLTLSGAANDFYAYPQGVVRRALDMQQASGNAFVALLANIRRLLSVRRAVRSFRADVVLSLGDRTNVLMLLALAGLRCRKVISERADPVLEPLSRGWSLLRRLAYPMASLHVSQSQYISEWVSRNFPGMATVVIGNASSIQSDGVSRNVVRQRDGVEGTPVRLITVGRLSKQKGIDLLLDAFAQARTMASRSIVLNLVGDGEDRAALMRQSEVLGLNGSVRFVGRVSDVGEWLCESDICVLPSRSEGFPNAMIEAMACGLPVIAARCRGGVEDVLVGADGMCALDFPPGDTGKLAQCIVRMVEDDELRARLAQASMMRAADYGIERISAAWRAVVEAE